jgi:hypothetical protein
MPEKQSDPTTHYETLSDNGLIKIEPTSPFMVQEPEDQNAEDFFDL